MIACVGLLVELVIQPIRALRDLADTDFVNFVAAARILRSGACLYCIAPQEVASHLVVGGPLTTHIVVFVSPPVVALAFSPLSTIDPHAALAIFLVLSLAALVLAGWLIASRWLPNLSTRQRVGLVAASVASAPAAWGIAIGQLDPLLFCAVVAGITVSRRRPIVGGLLIGVLAVKPQMFLLIPVALILGRNGRVVIGAGIAMTGLALSTLLLMGWNHLLDWPRFVMSPYDAAPLQSISVPLTIGRLTGSGALALILSLLLISIGVLVLWRRRDQLADVGTAVTFGLTLTMLASPHLLAYDALFLTIPLVWVARWNWPRALALALSLSPAYFIDSYLAPAAFWGVASPGASVMESFLLVGIAVGVVGDGKRVRVNAQFPGRIGGTWGVTGRTSSEIPSFVLRWRGVRHLRGVATPQTDRSLELPGRVIDREIDRDDVFSPSEMTTSRSDHDCSHAAARALANNDEGLEQPPLNGFSSGPDEPDLRAAQAAQPVRC